ncbi:hypothetical protein [Streptobacillus moniliformis]|uniref:hypothetical protein n=1 Tax=Streptobacillus moniliformis TaxID=34105 RepID=UPI0007E4D904|nr:hypothetical protein [Streptobacillus moniliformis]
MSKYVYDTTGAFIASFFDEIEDNDILSNYPGAIIKNEYVEYSKIKDNDIVSMSDDEIQAYKFKEYQENRYTLSNNEILENDKVVKIELKEFEYIENGILKFNYESKRDFLINKTKTYEQVEKEKLFEFKGYLQPNRELEDQTSLLKILSFMQMTQQTVFDKWKMKDKEGHEHYVSLTIQEMMKLGQIMQKQTTNAMQKWSKIREDIKNMSEEELKDYELPRE